MPCDSGYFHERFSIRSGTANARTKIDFTEEVRTHGKHCGGAWMMGGWVGGFDARLTKSLEEIHRETGIVRRTTNYPFNCIQALALSAGPAGSGKDWR